MEEKKVTVEEPMTPEEVLAAMLKYMKGLRKEVGIIKKSMVSEQKLSYSNQDCPIRTITVTKLVNF